MPENCRIHRVDASLYLIDLPVSLKGFEGFITTWVFTGGPVVVVDVGPSSGSECLRRALDDIGVTRPDAFLLTHIHLDHAGGIGHLSQAFPQTPIICHPKAVKHLADPQRLWEGSIKTLGNVAEGYGAMIPVANPLIVPADEMQLPGLTALPTPGHAPHQYSYLITDVVFAGEAGGVCISLENGGCYMRPATPPRFFMETCLESIDRLLAAGPERICYGHVGMQPDARKMLHTHREQLVRWRQLIEPWHDEDSNLGDERMEALLDHLLSQDPLLSDFSRFPADARERERFFLRNSIKGYWGYLSEA
ncbi:MAG: MBL fold metallo-hydrolase [Desulfatitalea sp.]|nr:MBL fold metallo-hydrolase [Desulfatitalea sp.]NNK01148.1 MBL fold metallo-hydrolase [Desulfatitalea sp.]